jgi:DNA replication licensing factor MCM6
MQISTMKEFDQETLFVDFQHVLAHDNMLASALSEEYYRCGTCT